MSSFSTILNLIFMVPESDNKRIAKNTTMLYFRMLFTMAVGLYTSRVVLERLGVNDYGIYNVVGGVVTMFSIVSASLSSAISRFLTFELGKGNISKLRVIFSTSLMIQLAIGLIVAVLVEGIGVWFLNAKMNIAPERLGAANWVLQCSLVTFIINMISLPYNASIIAHEKMQAFAYVSFLEAFLKLGIAFLLFVPLFDTLEYYAVLLVVSSAIVRWVYGLYCRRNFEECKFQRVFDKKLLKEMLSFSGWNFIGSTSGILRDQGVNIVMNIFCGTAVNAARGVAVQVNTIVSSFSNNFMIAVNPQIIKSYAIGELEHMFILSNRSSRFSYYLLFLISFPVILAAPYVLGIWLTVVPDHTVIFMRLILILGMSEALSLPLQFINQATGNIKLYQLTVGGLQLLNFPISYLALYFGMNPSITFVIAIIISQICMFARLGILHKTVRMSVESFLKDVYTNVMLVSIVAVPIPLLYVALNPADNFPSFMLSTVISLLCSIFSVLFVGCGKNEREKLFSLITRRLKIKKNA